MGRVYVRGRAGVDRDRGFFGSKTSGMALYDLYRDEKDHGVYEYEG